MLSLGYTEEDMELFIGSYELRKYTCETVALKIKDIYNFLLLEQGHSQEDIIKMTKDAPEIYGLNIDNMKQKITAKMYVLVRVKK